LDRSVFEQRKQFQKEKQQAIQQSTTAKKKPPPMPPPPQAAMPPQVVMLSQEEVVKEPRRIANMTTEQGVSDFKWKDMTANLLKRAIPAEMATWSEEKREQIESKYKKTAYIVALMEYIVSQLPSTYSDGTKLGGGERRVQWYKKAFPRGVITFTVPSAGREKNKLPDPMYESIEGTKIHLTRWDLNAPDYAIPCLECKDGLLKKVRFHTGKLMSAMTPIFDTYGPTGYEMGGYYSCNNSESCKCRVKSTDGKLLRALPGWLTKSFPVDPKWINPSGYFHLARSASRFLEQAMLTQGSAKWVSEMMYENQNEYYKEKEAAYYSGEKTWCHICQFSFA
jgi:hypothetical protein